MLHRGQVEAVAGLVVLLHPVYSYQQVEEEGKEEEAVEEKVVGKEPLAHSLVLAILRLQPSYTQELVLMCLAILATEEGEEQAAMAAFITKILELPSTPPTSFTSPSTSTLD